MIYNEIQSVRVDFKLFNYWSYKACELRWGDSRQAASVVSMGFQKRSPKLPHFCSWPFTTCLLCAFPRPEKEKILCAPLCLVCGPPWLAQRVCVPVKDWTLCGQCWRGVGMITGVLCALVISRKKSGFLGHIDFSFIQMKWIFLKGDWLSKLDI